MSAVAPEALEAEEWAGEMPRAEAQGGVKLADRVSAKLPANDDLS